MSADINRHRTKRGASKIEPSRFWSQIDEGDNKIVIPWSITENHPLKSIFQPGMENQPWIANHMLGFILEER